MIHLAWEANSMLIFNQASIKLSKGFRDGEENKPDQATMRPGCVSMCIDHVTYTILAINIRTVSV